MTASKETVDRRELIAEDINTFLDGVGVPKFLRVKAENITVTTSGARVSLTISDVGITVDVGENSLQHLVMVRGLAALGRKMFSYR